jgi:hypothetical protein
VRFYSTDHCKEEKCGRDEEEGIKGAEIERSKREIER